MKKLLLTFIAMPLLAAPPEQWVGAGIQWNQHSSPQINGVLAYAKRVIGEKNYTYNSVWINSVSKNPYRVGTSVETGLARYITKFGEFDVYTFGTGGVIASDDNVGYTVSGGWVAQAGVGKGFTFGPMLKISKSSLGGTQWALGLVAGWGDKK